MDTAYAQYLLLVALVTAGAVLIGTLLFVVIRGRMGKKHNVSIADKTREDNTENCIVDSGNVSVFFDKHRNAVLIPYVPDIFGSGKATADIMKLYMPYRSDELGHAVKSAMTSCRNGKPAGSAALMKLLSARDWKEFTKGRLSISVHYKEGRGIMMNSSVRTPEGAYVYITKNPEICLPAGVGNTELGDAILGLLKKCR